MENNSIKKQGGAEKKCRKCGGILGLSTSNANRGKTKTCTACRQSAWYENNREYVRDKSKEYYQRTRETRIKYAKEWRLANLAKHREDAWAYKLRRMGSSPEIYNAALERQGHVCALCGKPPTKHRLCQDHCHRRIKPRGALCNRCNFVVGQYETMLKDIPKIQAYLSQYE